MPLTERERLVLEAVIDTFVQTAEPAGSRTVSKVLGAFSPATIRNTMSDLEEKGYLYHPHTSAGRIPTDLAYRAYVDLLMSQPPPVVTATEADAIRAELIGRSSAVDVVLERAAQVLAVLTKELGVAIGPTLDQAVLERLDLTQISSERLLLVLTLRSGVVRTIFVEVPSHMASEAIAQVAVVLNERLAGLALREIRATLSERLRDAAPGPGAGELLGHLRAGSGRLVRRSARRRRGGGGAVPARRCWPGSPSSPPRAGCRDSWKSPSGATWAPRGPDAPSRGANDHHRGRASGSQARALHARDGALPGGAARRGDRRAGTDAHAGRRRWWHW